MSDFVKQLNALYVLFDHFRGNKLKSSCPLAIFHIWEYGGTSREGMSML